MKMTTAQVVETSVFVNNNGPIRDYVHPHYHKQPLFLKSLLGSNLSQKNYLPTKENIFHPTPNGEEKCDVACFAIPVCFEAAPNRIFGMQDLLYLKAGIRDFKS